MPVEAVRIAGKLRQLLSRCAQVREINMVQSLVCHLFAVLVQDSAEPESESVIVEANLRACMLR